MKNSIKQLLRTPLRTILFVLLLTLISTFLCLGGGLWFTAQQGLDDAEENFTTIAVPNYAAMREYSGVRANTFTGDIAAFNMNRAAQQEADKRMVELLEKVKQAGLSSAIAQPSTRQWLMAYAGEENSSVRPEDAEYTFLVHYNAPFDRAAYLGTCTDVKPVGMQLEYVGDRATSLRTVWGGIIDPTSPTLISRYASHTVVPVYATTYAFRLDEVICVQEQAPRMPEFLVAQELYPYSEEEKNDLEENGFPLEVGKQYLMVGVYGASASIIGADAMDREGVFFPPNTPYMTINNEAAYKVGKVSLAPYNVYRQELYVDDESRFPYEQMAVEVPGTLEEFLADPANKYWKDVLHDMKVTNNSVYVMATDKLNTIFSFNQNRVSIADGREISHEEFAYGQRVCLISRRYAQLNKLNVGDALPLQFYPGRFNAQRHPYDVTHPSIATHYDSSLGMTDAQDYTIVGIYDGEIPWDVTDYGFGANTVIVPEASVPPVADVQSPYNDPLTDYESPNLFTLTIPNNAAQAFYDEMGEVEYGRLYNIMDQGYSTVVPGLRVIRNNAAVLLGVCVLAWIAVVILFLLIFVLRQRKEAGEMLSLGAGKGRTTVHFLVSAVLISMLAAGLSIGAGLLLYEKVFDVALNASTLETTYSAKYSEMPVYRGTDEEQRDLIREAFVPRNKEALVAGVAIAQLLLVSGATLICTRMMIRQNPMELVRSKEE